VSVLHAESSEDCGEIPLLSETDPITIAVDLDAEELACRPEVRHFVFLREFRFYFDCGFGSSLLEGHGDIVDIKKYQNAIAVEIEVGIG